ncbi:hypothetical protein DSO57_1033787 [Entomophthora muscae]|uniref:Uncharacterized protein n=1 Tax=Entomophthora muscae TaxID=34485 RepID=A0ACC2ULN0_9FUNG|nr:hypothetical protein DSO57_1033787 [Entomophthora muscae]
MKNINISNTGKKIFLTGVTGFVGMAVLEKILRDQYDLIDCVYTLARASKGEAPATRGRESSEEPCLRYSSQIPPQLLLKGCSCRRRLIAGWTWAERRGY